MKSVIPTSPRYQKYKTAKIIVFVIIFLVWFQFSAIAFKTDKVHVNPTKNAIIKKNNLKMRISIIFVKKKIEAQNILKDLSTGAAFTELARRYSVGPYKDEGGDFGYIEPGYLMEPLNTIAINLKIGEYSEIIRTEKGYFIIMKTNEEIFSVELPPEDKIKKEWLKPSNAQYLIFALLCLIIWLGGLITLFLTGMALSKITLRAIEEQDSKKLGEATGIVLLIRRLYAIIINLTSIYFYISIPIIILLVVGAGCGTIYSFFISGRIPIKLVIIIGSIMLATLYAFIKSLLIRPIYKDPGYRLEAKDAPQFFSILNELSLKVNAPVVDSAFITSDASIAVFERGSFLKRLRKATEHCLILGLGALKGMTQLQLKSILAHEFGHISNRDTAGGSMALHVRRSILVSAEAMAEGGAAIWYNPAWIFLNSFYRIYLRISQGASRLQEVLADQWAASLFGSDTFVKGLKHIIKRSIEFRLLSNIEINEAIKKKRQIKNIYMLELPKEWPKTDEKNNDWENRIPCNDESCIGTIGPDGRCRECGKSFNGEKLKDDVKLNAVSDSIKNQTTSEDEENNEQKNALSPADFTDKNDEQILENDRKKVITPKQTVEEAFVKIMEETTSPYDSHPSPKQRIEWVSKLNIILDIVDDGRPAWLLLDNSEFLQKKMIQQLNENIQNYI